MIRRFGKKKGTKVENIITLHEDMLRNVISLDPEEAIRGSDGYNWFDFFKYENGIIVMVIHDTNKTPQKKMLNKLLKEAVIDYEKTKT